MQTGSVHTTVILVEVTSVVLRSWGVPDGPVDPQFSHKEHSYQFHGILLYTCLQCDGSESGRCFSSRVDCSDSDGVGALLLYVTLCLLSVATTHSLHPSMADIRTEDLLASCHPPIRYPVKVQV